MRLSVTLRDIDPPITREITVPASMTLGELHMALQLSMGWTNSHLHAFKIGDSLYGEPLGDDALDDPDLKNEHAARLAVVAGNVGFTFTYDYDFGDGWRHTVKLLAFETPATELDNVIPWCTAGKGACPPEDCGGPYGYANLLVALGKSAKDRTDHERELVAWLKGFQPRFNPRSFDRDKANKLLVYVFGPKLSRKRLRLVDDDD